MKFLNFTFLVASIILSHTPNSAQCMDNLATWNVKHGHTKGNWLGKSSRPIRSIRNPPFPRPILDRPPWPFVYFAGDLLQMLLFVLTGSQLIIVRHLWRFTQWSNGPPKNVHVVFFFFLGGGAYPHSWNQRIFTLYKYIWLEVCSLDHQQLQKNIWDLRLTALTIKEESCWNLENPWWWCWGCWGWWWWWWWWWWW